MGMDKAKKDHDEELLKKAKEKVPVGDIMKYLFSGIYRFNTMEEVREYIDAKKEPPVGDR